MDSSPHIRFARFVIFSVFNRKTSLISNLVICDTMRHAPRDTNFCKGVFNMEIR